MEMYDVMLSHAQPTWLYCSCTERNYTLGNTKNTKIQNEALPNMTSSMMKCGTSPIPDLVFPWAISLGPVYSVQYTCFWCLIMMHFAIMMFFSLYRCRYSAKIFLFLGFFNISLQHYMAWVPRHSFMVKQWYSIVEWSDIMVGTRCRE